MEFTREELALLAQIERDMDSGKQPFVVFQGGRWAFGAEVLADLGVESGQTVSDVLLWEIQRHNLRKLHAEIAARNFGGAS